MNALRKMLLGLALVTGVVGGMMAGVPQGAQAAHNYVFHPGTGRGLTSMRDILV